MNIYRKIAEAIKSLFPHLAEEEKLGLEAVNTLKKAISQKE